MQSRQGSAALMVAVMSVVLTAGVSMAFGQSAIDLPTKAPGSKEPPVPVLALAPGPAVKDGKVAAVKGTVDGDGLRFAVGSLSILQPVVIALIAGNPADDLKLTLFKKEWKQPRRAGTTGTNGRVLFTFRTEGGVNILVQSPGPLRPFTLVAWAGEEIRPASMKPVIVTPAQFKGAASPRRDVAGTGTGAAPSPATTTRTLASSSFGWVVAGGLGVLVAVLGVVVFRRTRK